MTDRVPEIEFSGKWSHPKNGFKASLKHGFSSCFAKFMAYFDNFLKFLITNVGILHFESSSNMPENLVKKKKNLVQLTLNPFLSSKTRGFGVPDLSLMETELLGFWICIRHDV